MLDFFIDVLRINSLSKILFLIVIIVYIIFAFVVFNQTRVMTRVARVSFSGVLIILSILHLLLAISLFALGLVIL